MKKANRNIKIEHPTSEFDNMTAPKVFISSTCYDLSIIRENLEKFIESFGYIPIKSERGSIYFDTNKDVMDACIDEVPNCQMLISVIGGRFGSEYKVTGKSITNMEVNKARESKVPIFALVDKKVLNHYELWKVNKDKDITYPNVQSTKIFEFIENVKNASVNNALQPFDTFEDIRSYLLQQWSGMIYNYLTTESQAKRVDETLLTLRQMNTNIEIITKQILETTSADKVNYVETQIKINELISKSKNKRIILADLEDIFNKKWIPKDIIKNETFEKFLKYHKITLKLEYPDKGRFELKAEHASMVAPLSLLDEAKKEYLKIVEGILSILKEYNTTTEQFLSGKNK